MTRWSGERIRDGLSCSTFAPLALAASLRAIRRGAARGGGLRVALPPFGSEDA